MAEGQSRVWTLRFFCGGTWEGRWSWLVVEGSGSLGKRLQSTEVTAGGGREDPRGCRKSLLCVLRAGCPRVGHPQVGGPRLDSCAQGSGIGTCLPAVWHMSCCPASCLAPCLPCTPLVPGMPSWRHTASLLPLLEQTLCPQVQVAVQGLASLGSPVCAARALQPENQL